MTTHSADKLTVLLRTLKLPSFKEQYEEVGRLADREGWTFAQYLLQLAEAEIEDRRQRRIERLLRQSGLPKDKTLATLDQKRLSSKIRRQIATLCEGGFVQRAENVLAFGLPGRGKTHCISAIGHELVQRGYEVLFKPAFAIVQRLLIAKRELSLEKELRRLDRFAVVILDDIGYVQQDREEMEVLFTLLAERYERRSVVISSNLVFSQWDQIFKDPMTTAAAIDRVVHHSVILELTGESYRSEQAKKRNAETSASSARPAKAKAANGSAG
jgi:DNA replication protein DnaC